MSHTARTGLDYPRHHRPSVLTVDRVSMLTVDRVSGTRLTWRGGMARGRVGGQAMLEIEGTPGISREAFIKSSISSVLKDSIDWQV
eukprot:2661715-Pyramimonas_sp.AAC.1